MCRGAAYTSHCSSDQFYTGARSSAIWVLRGTQVTWSGGRSLHEPGRSVNNKRVRSFDPLKMLWCSANGARASQFANVIACKADRL